MKSFAKITEFGLALSLSLLAPTITFAASDSSTRKEFEGVWAYRSSLLYLTPGLVSDKVNWRWMKLPEPIERALPKAMRDAAGNYCVEQHDLDADGKQEYLVFDRLDNANGSMTNYGSGYEILQDQKGKWKLIGWIYGGFNITLHSREKGDYSEIETWWHDAPSIKHSFWKYKKQRYEMTSSIEWPKEFRSNAKEFIPFDESQKVGCR
ncbi:MAG: hypothetical protein IPO13_02645 [Rhodocyclaceae bacterium]|nr:hypothetical protein [Rhodocyclaceae bacterium]